MSWTELLTEFSERSAEACDIFKRNKKDHVLIRQPRQASSFDATNRVSGVLIYDPSEGRNFALVREEIQPTDRGGLVDFKKAFRDSFSRKGNLIGKLITLITKTQEAIPTYYPRIALIPVEGSTNAGLLNLLNNYPAIVTEKVDAIELGFSESKKRRNSLSASHRDSVLAREMTRNTNLFGAIAQSMIQTYDETSLIGVSCREDSSHLPALLSALQETHLLRPQIMEATRYTVDQFCLKASFPRKADNDKTLRQNLLSVLSNQSQPQP